MNLVVAIDYKCVYGEKYGELRGNIGASNLDFLFQLPSSPEKKTNRFASRCI
jgi:hypothetical protein